jgi:omega-hydroxy-beta-dihydromenaquinone-9 sulfotransferase
MTEKKPSLSKPREWAPRMWEGCDTLTLLKLLFKNRFAVEPQLAYIAFVCSVMSYLNTGLRVAQRGLWGRRIDETKIINPPLFVLGHWRTGTTLLHELLILDPQHSYPDTHACLLPNHFLLSESFFKKYLGFLMPGKRPMDNMALGWERPQEDEFALALLGVPSPYHDMAFPNRESLHPGSLDLSGLTPSELARWKRVFLNFVRELTFRDNRRLILKSPTHTARIKILLELFPDAKFVNIVRDPKVLYSSTINLWTNMAKAHGFQAPRRLDLIEAKVLREFRVIYERYFEERHLIPKKNLIEVRYEDFTSDLVAGTEKIYQGLELTGWNDAKPRIVQYANGQKNYEKNKFQLNESQLQRIQAEWGDLIEKLGYA